jgi:hypothetical protein
MSEHIESFKKACNEGLAKEKLESLFDEFEKDKKLRIEAREYCLGELKDEPKNGRCRLFLANLYYIDGYAEFCVRELIELKKYSELESVDRLLESFGNFGQSFVQAAVASDAAEETEIEEEAGDVMAELDFDSDFIDVLDELDEEDLQ